MTNASTACRPPRNGVSSPGAAEDRLQRAATQMGIHGWPRCTERPSTTPNRYRTASGGPVAGDGPAMASSRVAAVCDLNLDDRSVVLVGRCPGQPRLRSTRGEKDHREPHPRAETLPAEAAIRPDLPLAHEPEQRREQTAIRNPRPRVPAGPTRIVTPAASRSPPERHVHDVPTERALRPAAPNPDPSIPQLAIRCGRMRIQAESQPLPNLSPPSS